MVSARGDWPGVLWSVLGLTGLVFCGQCWLAWCFVVSARGDWPGALWSVLGLTGQVFCGQC